MKKSYILIKNSYFALALLSFIGYFTFVNFYEWFKIVEYLPILGIVILVLDPKFDKLIIKSKSVFIFLLFVLISLGNGFKRQEILMGVILTLIYWNEDNQEVIKTYIIVMTLTLILSTFLSSINVLPNNIHLRDSNDPSSIRHAFIFNHSNQMGLMCCATYLGWLIYYRNIKYKYLMNVGGLILFAFVLFYVDSKTSALSILFADILYFVQFCLNNKIFDNLLKKVNKYSFLIPIVFFVCSILMTVLFSKNIGLIKLLDSTLTGRIRLQSMAFEHMGIPIFGQYLNDSGIYIDSFYIQSIYNYGFFPTIVMFSFISYLLYKLNSYYPSVNFFSIVLVICAVGICEPVCINIMVNPYIICLLCSTLKKELI